MLQRCLCFAWLFFILFTETSAAIVSGKVINAEMQAVPNANLEIVELQKTSKTNKNGAFSFDNIQIGTYNFYVTAPGYLKMVRTVEVSDSALNLSFQLQRDTIRLKTVIVEDDNHDAYNWGAGNLHDVDGTTINANKKNEVINTDEIVANKSVNNARQIYAKVSGLNIWEGDCGGLQIAIGGRGLSPSRNASFNTRQNGYDISADALGYPDAYYNPPVEALERIEIVRGAASLQYGTQFGGVVNFKLRQGSAEKRAEITFRETVASYGLINSFNSVGGSIGKWNYYTFYQYKRGTCWRPNSNFHQHTFHFNSQYKLSKKWTVGAEYTHMDYLAKQAGGLTDAQFEDDPRQSFRNRNWFQVHWNLGALIFNYEPNHHTKLNIRTFGLLADRASLGNLDPVTRLDNDESDRDLIVGTYKNIGNETRLLHKYHIKNKEAVVLLGTRLYRGNTLSKQGTGSAGRKADFNFISRDDKLEGSEYENPSENIALFNEHIFYLNDKLSITPGLRFEHIRTVSDGYYRVLLRDRPGNIIADTLFYDLKDNARQIGLAGIGIGYDHSDSLEIYANISQNYRSITFSDLRIVNPNFRINENLHDERGFNADFGLRGHWQKLLHFDVSLFYLRYQNRIGEVLRVDERLGTVYRERANIADSRNIGIELLLESNVMNWFRDKSRLQLNLYVNTSFIDAVYLNADEKAFEGKKVELVPPFTLKTGVNARLGSFQLTWQYSYVGEHFSDATNAEFTSTGTIGIIPSYGVMDLAASFDYKRFRFETGINNVLNTYYYTRRATGYPGPGILPSDPRTFYFTLQVKI